MLKKAKLFACDFETTLNRAREGDLVFVDPPYTVSHNNNGFVKYNDVLFSWEDQKRLAHAVKRACKAGAYVLVSNANHNTPSDLYTSFMKRVTENNRSGRILLGLAFLPIVASMFYFQWAVTGEVACGQTFHVHARTFYVCRPSCHILTPSWCSGGHVGRNPF